MWGQTGKSQYLLKVRSYANAIVNILGRIRLQLAVQITNRVLCRFYSYQSKVKPLVCVTIMRRNDRRPYIGICLLKKQYVY